MADPPGPKPVIEPRPGRPDAATVGDMNGFLDIATVLSLAIGTVFLLSGAVLPFLSHERKSHR